MKEYLIMFLTFFKLIIIKLRLGKNFSVSYIQRIRLDFITEKGATIHLGWNNCFSKYGQLFVGKQGHLTIGSNVYFNNNAYISCQNVLSIGDNCIFGPNVTVIDNNHTFSKNEGVNTSTHNVGEIHIGANCWIAANVVILKDTTIGDNCVIGAGCVVKGTIPKGSIVTNENTLKVKEIK